MSIKEIKTIWLKVKKTRILFECLETDKPMYPSESYAIATEQEVKDWQSGNYWSKKTEKDSEPKKK
ncbi:MAG: hypothetical protein ACRCTS_03555 [Fusobacteriaceae bacterium]